MEAISVFDIFKIGVGPSSSHTMGPWRAARRFLESCREAGAWDSLAGIRVDLYGSLAKTGKGHGTDVALVLGLRGEDVATCDLAVIPRALESARAAKTLDLLGEVRVEFDPDRDLVFNRQTTLPFHPNGMTFTARLRGGGSRTETYFSVGGGFIVREGEESAATGGPTPPLPVETAADLLGHCRALGLSIPEVARRNETARTPEEIRNGLRAIWETMRACAWRGCHAQGDLPGGLGVARRAAALNRDLLGKAGPHPDPESWLEAVRKRGGSFQDILKWVSCFALAVNEENAAFGRVVTAPTNGAAGVIPAVLLYLTGFAGGDEAAVEDFLLTAAAVGILFKRRSTLSAALGGCQAEIGVSSAMAAAALTQCQGGSPERVLMAAEIAMEHHLGLTCDPVGGLVQIPCIERNTMGAVKAVTASQLALAGDPSRAKVSLDAVIRSMWETAKDMNTKYKETSEGGLALHIPVNVAEC